MFDVHPEPWGFMIQFDDCASFFSDGVLVINHQPEEVVYFFSWSGIPILKKSRAFCQ